MNTYQQRVAALSQRMDDNDLDYVVVLPGANFTYNTGFTREIGDRPLVAFFSADGYPSFIAPRLELKAINQVLSYDARIFSYTDAQGYENAFTEACARLKLSGKRIGVEYRGMRLLELRQLEQNLTDCEIRQADTLLMEGRMTKDTEELTCIREAIRITEQALNATLTQIRAGQTELEVQSILHMELFRAGVDGLAFPSIVLSGGRATLPHGTAGEREIVEGDCLLFDFGGKCGNYMADITRTFAIGTTDPEWKDIYEVVKGANAAARKLASPGVKAEDVDSAARAVIEEAGYGDYFTHRTGHSLGLEVHEPPYIVAGDKTNLQPGMTFTIEPGIYIPDKYGVRIEDDVLVTENGCESLTTFPRELISL